MAEGYIQITPDSSGKQVRNLVIPVQQTDGTTATVYVQAVVIVDASGAPVDFGELLSTQQEILAVLKQLRFGIAEHVGMDLEGRE